MESMEEVRKRFLQDLSLAYLYVVGLVSLPLFAVFSRNALIKISIGVAWLVFIVLSVKQTKKLIRYI